MAFGELFDILKVTSRNIFNLLKDNITYTTTDIKCK